MLAGIDVSSNNGAVAWPRVRLGGAGELAFAFAKATEGVTWNDPQFGANWHGMRERGLVRGAYHFARPGTNSAVAEAEHLLSALQRVGGIHPGDLPPVLDLEVSAGLSGPGLHAWVETWVHTVAAHVGRPPIIYTGGFWKSNLTSAPTAWGCPLWLAQYGPAAQVPRPWSQWTFWQFTDAGRAQGIQGACDVSWFHGSGAQLEALAGGAAGSHAPSAAAPAALPHPPYPGHPLTVGSHGPQVHAWQLRMHERGFAHVPTTGTFDATCAESCRWLQLYLRFPPTGEVDARTWAATWTAP